ncbi:UDP-N-acetylmuramoyl-L-alanyl-D-glutamate--2,6-diaminopimelate ligase MurE homolog, chloroplastic-like [Hibiscus syriacus]|uniref:UDP-N-acetylmuramoyl-L-alanyl-D-glutamate--2, 6-diaminopimelate ligase MurE homolog, chloroplastic-like n=1 Tax=Hibiscus syriacus TaxID=106335 RepID=UPI00192408A1|nr:UDP-N-acetylmuramoyl-L-alanyl-D-glutamate--2,6-diaminopimelate ligase MurE homolog, chloroplastic-like [Hibiscus syriacus]
MAAFSFTLFSPTFLSPRYRFISPKTRHSHRHHHIPFKLLAITPNRKYYLNTFDDDGIERFQQILCQATRDGKLLHQDFKRKRGVLTGRVKSKFWNPSTQQDSREVKAGDLFVCCVGSSFDARRHLTEAHRRGAVSVIASKGNGIEETSGYKTLVIVEDANSVLATLAASFYGYPSKSMTVIAINGTNGKTTTTYLVKGLYEALGVWIGLLGTIGYYIHGDNKLGLESPLTTPDANVVQILMAKMFHNGSKAVVMEASSHGLSVGRCMEADFNIAVLTNFTRDHLDFHGTMDEYKKAKAKLFQRMVDPESTEKSLTSTI